MTDPKELELRLSELQAQLKAAQSHLERTERLAAVGGLVNEIAHEINTPLSALRSGNATLALVVQRLRSLIGPGGIENGRKNGVDELLLVAEDTVRTDRLACERIASIIQGLRSSLRREQAAFTRANIQPEIENSLALLAYAFKNRILLTKDYGVLPEIECNPERLGQVFLNILVNAVQAIEGRGEIRIRAWQEGDAVRISICDTGKGIPSEMQSRIFDPGFTTKGADKGTGLGLFISRTIVQQHGGCIEVESEEGKGATFTIVLPIRQTQERKTNDR